MSRFHGPQGKGAMRRYRDLSRGEAEERQASERTRDEAREAESRRALAQWRGTPEGRAARRFARDLERRLQGAFSLTPN